MNTENEKPNEVESEEIKSSEFFEETKDERFYVEPKRPLKHFEDDGAYADDEP